MADLVLGDIEWNVLNTPRCQALCVTGTSEQKKWKMRNQEKYQQTNILKTKNEQIEFCVEMSGKY